jgi:hypothetical protein
MTKKDFFLDCKKDFFLACKKGHIEDLRTILQNKPAVNVNAGLLLACKHGRLEAAKMLIAAGARNFDDALHRACEGRKPELVQLIASKRPKNIRKCLLHACLENNAPIASVLVKYVNRQTLNHMLEESFNKKPEILRLLIKSGANDHVECFYRACLTNHPETVRVIMFHFNIRGCLYNGLLDACTRGHVNIVTLLWPECTHEMKINAYLTACHCGRVPVVKFIMASGLYIAMSFTTGIFQKGLERARDQSQFEMTCYLLSKTDIPGHFYNVYIHYELFNFENYVYLANLSNSTVPSMMIIQNDGREVYGKYIKSLEEISKIIQKKLPEEVAKIVMSYSFNNTFLSSMQ